MIMVTEASAINVTKLCGFNTGFDLSNFWDRGQRWCRRCKGR